MYYAIISDIHSNVEALQTAIEYIGTKSVDGILCLGDVVGYGPDPNECIEIVRKHCLCTVRGNHDSAAVDLVDSISMNILAQEAAKWTHDRLTASSREFLQQLPYRHTIENATLVHATPHRPDAWGYIISRYDAETAFDFFETKYCFIGHSHRPAVYTANSGGGDAGKKRIVNVGSIGQPRDNNPKLSFGFFDTVTLEYENVRLSYAVERTAKKIIEAGLPPALAERLYYGL
jgi:predicted phosphodiesterase